MISNIYDIPVPFSLVFQGNFDNTNHIISGVSNTPQFFPNGALSHLSRNL